MLTKQRLSPTEISAAKALVVEDPDVQGGAATFKAARIPVQQVAKLLARRADEAELFEDYPRLTQPIIDAAGIYDTMHPNRGHARNPDWLRLPYSRADSEAITTMVGAARTISRTRCALRSVRAATVQGCRTVRLMPYLRTG
jgi:uncharacterized protein (DUF433 family)